MAPPSPYSLRAQQASWLGLVVGFRPDGRADGHKVHPYGRNKFLARHFGREELHKAIPYGRTWVLARNFAKSADGFFSGLLLGRLSAICRFCSVFSLIELLGEAEADGAGSEVWKGFVPA